jgi:hypothetical protein
MKMFVEKLIEVNKFVNNEIQALQETIATSKFETEKDRINFGNLCTALTGFRLVNDAMEALLANEDVVVTDTGNYYQKIDSNTPEPPAEQEQNEKKDE